MIDTSQDSYEMEKNNMNDLMKEISEEVKLEQSGCSTKWDVFFDVLDGICDEKILDWKNKEDWILLRDYLISLDEFRDNLTVDMSHLSDEEIKELKCTVRMLEEIKEKEKKRDLLVNVDEMDEV